MIHEFQPMSRFKLAAIYKQNIQIIEIGLFNNAWEKKNVSSFVNRKQFRIFLVRVVENALKKVN